MGVPVPLQDHLSLEEKEMMEPLELTMAKYMYSGNYTSKGAAGLLNDGGKARHEEAEKAATSMGAHWRHTTGVMGKWTS